MQPAVNNWVKYSVTSVQLGDDGIFTVPYNIRWEKIQVYWSPGGTLRITAAPKQISEVGITGKRLIEKSYTDN